MVPDFFGVEIKPGDTVAYPVRQGSSMWLNRMQVLQVEPGRLRGTSPEGRRVNIVNVGNVIVNVAARKPE